MAKPVFISHASEDAAIARQVCETLERQGIGCWIAPRNMRQGRQDYPAQIVAAIESAAAAVLVLTERANASRHVLREIVQACEIDLPIFVLRIGDVKPSLSLRYFLADLHWGDAWTPPQEAPLRTLAEAIRATVDPAPPEVREQPAPGPAVVPDPETSWPDLHVFRDRLAGGGFGPEMVVLPAGEFLMGSPDSDKEAGADEKPQHLVRIGYRFAVGRSPVTFEDWDACLADGGVDYRPDDEGWGRGRRPVIKVSWQDAKQYLAWLSRKTGRPYRLLSEAEWEYAARGGTSTRRWWGDEIAPDKANYGRNIGRTTEVGTYPENPFKLYDVLGNVWEWVDDCWEDSYRNAPSDGSARQTAKSKTFDKNSARVLRGGSWFDVPRDVRSAYRNGYTAGYRVSGIGFRVARTF